MTLENTLLQVTNSTASRARLELEMNKGDQGLVSQRGVRAGMNRRMPVLPEDTPCRPNKTHLCTISTQWCQGALGSRADSMGCLKLYSARAE